MTVRFPFTSAISFRSFSSCAAEREPGGSLGWTGGEAFWVGTLGAACAGDGWVEVTAGVASGVPFSGIVCEMKAAVTCRCCIDACFSIRCLIFTLSHPVWSVNGRQSVQVRHGELQPPSPQIVIHVHHAHQGGRAAKRISPRLAVGFEEIRWECSVTQSAGQNTENNKMRKATGFTLSHVVIPPSLTPHNEAKESTNTLTS